MNDTPHIIANRDIHKYSIEQFDRTIIYIASGALGISFAFIKDIIPQLNKAENLWELMVSWYSFTAVILASLICHYLSMKGTQWALMHEHLEDTAYNAGVAQRNKYIRVLNLGMIIGLFPGIIFLILFINTNIYGK